MTWFTDSPFEKMMTQKPHGRHGDDKPPNVINLSKTYYYVYNK